MKEFDKAIITEKGNELITEAILGKKIEFTKLMTGCGTYEESEELTCATSLKEEKQEFLFTVNKKISENGLLLTTIISNAGLKSGYRLTEVGIYGKLQDSEEEILYAISVAEEEKAIFLPPYNGIAETEIELSCYITIKQDNIFKIALGDLVDIILHDIDAERIRAQEAENKLNNNKVDKVSGKGLSTNDYTTSEKNKLNGIAYGAEVNVQSDWNVADNKNTAFIKNKPTSLPASDVYDWAKQPNKPAYNKEEIGLGNVQNVSTNDQKPTFTQASTRANITSGEKMSVIFGKIMKWFSDLKTVAFSGSYDDLSNKPSIPTSLPANGGTAKTISDILPISKGGTGENTATNGLNALTAGASSESETYQFSDNDSVLWMYTSGAGGTFKTKFVKLWNYIKSKLATVATSGSYTDLKNKPTIPSVGNGTVTIKQEGTSKGTFKMNQSGDTTIELTDSNTTYGTATKSANGLMTAEMVTKLNGIANGANKTTVTNNDLATVAGTAWDAVRGAQIRRDVDAISSNLSELGTVYNNFTENIASGTNIDGNKFYNVCNITLQAGVYIVVGKVNVLLKQSVSILQGFYADGNRYGENSLKSDQRYVESIHLFKLSKATTIYLRTHISSTLSAIGTVYAKEMYAIKLK